MDAAIRFLRESGLAQADKKAARIATEGKIVLATSDDGKQAIMVEVNCETDFVAKDENFNAFACAVANNVLEMDGTDLAALMESNIDGSSIELARQALVAKLGENIQVRRIERVTGDGILGSYIHGGRIGVTLILEGGDPELARDLAMHVAALNPEFISIQDVPKEFLDREKEILVARASDSGKPPEIVEKMVSGRLRKRLAAITLLDQPFVKDTDVTVAQLLVENNASVTGFNRLEVGEGIEKKQENFAQEVMQQVTHG